MSLASRLWIYQSERFPLATHGLLVAALVVGGAGYASAGRGWPAPAVLVACYIVTLGSFLLLRLLDEKKDAADDAAYRAYRPVPRGLVTLRELFWVGVVVVVVQVGLSAWLGRGPLVALLAVWGGMALLAREFFVAAWLRRHPLLYMLSHMLVLPLIMLAILVAATPDGERLAAGSGWFLAAAYANGLVFEIGRKLRSAEDEEPGVETYSALWGVPGATAAWLLAMTAAAICAALAAQAIGAMLPVVVLSLVDLGAAGWVAWRMTRRPTRLGSRAIQLIGALWVLSLYLLLGMVGHL